MSLSEDGKKVQSMLNPIPSMSEDEVEAVRELWNHAIIRTGLAHRTHIKKLDDRVEKQKYLINTLEEKLIETRLINVEHKHLNGALRQEVRELRKELENGKVLQNQSN